MVRLEPFRVVDGKNEERPAPAVVTLREEPGRHPSYEGKSIEKNIDEIMQHEVIYDPNFLEDSWIKKNPVVRRGWQILIPTLLILAGILVYHQIDANRRLEQSAHSQQKDNLDHELDVARELVANIENTVRRYYAAASIEEKLPLIRHADSSQERMRHYYAQYPLQPDKIESINEIEPITLNYHTFWRAFVSKGHNRVEMILLEQIGESQVLVDWDSHVDYQAFPWEKYLEEKPNIAMSYRLDVVESARPIAEFSIERDWVCYRLTKPSSENILYGYVRRGSDSHLAIQTAKSLGSNRMILLIQASPTLKAENSVVIQEVISGSNYRMDPPKSLYD